MHKLITAACALALGLAWSAAPATAQTTKDKIENKAERTGEKIENKAERTGDKLENKAERAKDKAEGKSETVGDKVERGWDKTKAKTRELKDKVVNKTDRAADRAGDRAQRADGAADVRGAQMALKDKGFDPGPIDGRFGPRTSAAVREFQQKENLTVTGRLDAETRSRLGVMSSRADGTATTTAPAPAAGPASTTAPAPPAASPATDPAKPRTTQTR